MSTTLRPFESEYWELRARVRDVEACELDELRLRDEMARRLRQIHTARDVAGQRLNDCLGRIAGRLGARVEDLVGCAWDDERCELVKRDSPSVP